MSRFPVDSERLAGLSATRGGQVALAGFEYQRAFAVLRLASMHISQTVRGSATEIPVWLRYEWAEDIDELGADGKVTMWQCKIGSGWTGPSKLAEVLAGFAPKWLWTPSDDRCMLQFRLVTSDPAYAAHGELPGILPSKKAVKAAFLHELSTPAGAKSDRTQWQADADSADHDALFEALWDATRVLYVSERDATRPQSPWPAEEEALRVLALARRLGQHAAPRDALQALRALLGADALTADVHGNVQRAAAAPLALRPVDVADRLYAFSPPAEHPAMPFTLVDRTMLRGLRDASAGIRFVARRPEWADVVRGHDADIGFFERTLTTDLVDRLRQSLIDCTKQPGLLRLQWLVGAPGAGKSTLALRAASLLVSEGVCTAIDARFNLPKGDEVDGLVAEWQRLAASQRPLLLVLDDPLGVGSQWPAVLRKLSRGSPAIVVLAATPDFLLRKHGHELHDVAPLPDLPLPKPDPAERATLATIYSGMDQALLAGDDELLVITMQANAGVTFDAIIRGIWRTLADGMALADDTLVSDLPWEVAAFWLVVFFHRAYAPCPLPLLQGVLAERRADGQDMVERMSQLTLAQPHGWRIFQLDTPHPSFSYQGAGVRAMHARVAQRAWELRPAAHWNVANVIARASVAQYQSARRVAEALVALQQLDPSTARPVLAAVADAWADTRHASFEVRNLCELVAVWLGAMGQLPPVLTRALQFHVDKRDAHSWLAALQLLNVRAGQQQPRSASSEMPYAELIDVADFSVAPNRASKFAHAISDNPTLYGAFVGRLWKAFDGHLPWRPDAYLLTWLLARTVDADVRHRHEAICSWLRTAPNDTAVRTAFLGHLPKLPAEVQSEVLKDYRTWLNDHPENTDVRTAFLGHLPKLPAEVQSEVLKDYRTWLNDHPENTGVRSAFLAHLPKLPAEVQSDVLKDYRTWLNDHPENTGVRTAFLGHLPKLPAEVQPDVLKDCRTWLNDHPENTDVRTAFLGHLPKLPAEVQSEVLKDCRTWLNDHPENTDVRTAFLGHLPKLPAEVQSEVLKDYRTWLNDHPENTGVRSAFLAHLPKLPAEVQPEVLKDYRAWLIANPNDTNVREKLFATLSLHPALAIDADLQDGINFMNRAPANGNVGTALITLLASTRHQALPNVLAGLLAAISKDTRAFAPACAALSALDRLDNKHLTLTLHWLTWAADVLEAHHADRSAQVIVSAVSAAIDAATRQAQSTDCDADLRETAVKVIARVSAARTAWNRLNGYNRYSRLRYSPSSPA